MNGQERADCVVVGAGPAGSLTALLLARAGFQVILLDRQAFPRAKPCGDCISPPANILLEQLGLLPDVLASQPAALRGWRIFAPSGTSFAARFSDTTQDSRLHVGLAMPRALFDAVLLEGARSAGVRVLTGYRVDQLLRTQDQVDGVRARSGAGHTVQIKATLTVGADGLRSTVRQRLGLAARAPRLRKVGLTAQASGIAGLSDFGELHLGQGVCVGLAPTNALGSACNVTLVVDANRFGRELAGKRIDQFRRRLEQFPQLRERIAALELQSELLASGPFDRPVSDLVAPGAALVGDAAGYYDPFTGQGIFQALIGAQLLAAAATRALSARQAGQPLHAYAVQQRRLAGGARRVQRGIEFVCARPGYAERCIAALARAPRAAARLIAVTADLSPASSLLWPAPVLSFLLGFPGAHVRENAG